MEFICFVSQILVSSNLCLFSFSLCSYWYYHFVYMLRLKSEANGPIHKHLVREHQSLKFTYNLKTTF